MALHQGELNYLMSRTETLQRSLPKKMTVMDQPQALDSDAIATLTEGDFFKGLIASLAQQEFVEDHVWVADPDPLILRLGGT